MSNGRLVSELEFTAQRHAVGDPADRYLVFLRHALQIVGGCFAFYSRVGGDDHLAGWLLAQLLAELIQSQIGGSDSIQWGQAPHQYEVTAAVARRLLNGDDIAGGFNDAKLGLVPLLVGTDLADFQFSQVSATAATPDPLHCLFQYRRQVLPTLPVAFEQVQCHALSRLGTDTGKAAQ